MHKKILNFFFHFTKMKSHNILKNAIMCMIQEKLLRKFFDDV